MQTKRADAQVADVAVEPEQLDQVGERVGVAARHLDEAVLAGHQGCVVELVDEELAEAELGRARRDEPHRALHVEVRRSCCGSRWACSR